MNKVLENVLREVDRLPEEAQQRIARVLEEEVHKEQHTAARSKGRWVRLVERMRREAPLQGQSERFLRDVREFRDNFDLRVKPADE
jgi:hypothetical protein